MHDCSATCASIPTGGVRRHSAYQSLQVAHERERGTGPFGEVDRKLLAVTERAQIRYVAGRSGTTVPYSTHERYAHFGAKPIVVIDQRTVRPTYKA